MAQRQRLTTFVADNGVEIPAVTADQMRQVDRIAMEETGPNLFQMMENAGRNLASLSMQLLGRGSKDAGVVILAGPGGNGGGGIGAARHLSNHGVDVALCLSDPERLAPVPAYQRKVFASTSGREVNPRQLGDVRPELILDALIGYSLSGSPRGVAADLIRWANETKAPILALDVPSGIDATTGEAPGEMIGPRWTMTLALPKTGLFPDRTGQLYLADIGIPEGVYRRLQLPYRTPFDHRYSVRIEAVRPSPAVLGG